MNGKLLVIYWYNLPVVLLSLRLRRWLNIFDLYRTIFNGRTIAFIALRSDAALSE